MNKILWNSTPPPPPLCPSPKDVGFRSLRAQTLCVSFTLLDFQERVWSLVFPLVEKKHRDVFSQKRSRHANFQRILSNLRNRYVIITSGRLARRPPIIMIVCKISLFFMNPISMSNILSFTGEVLGFENLVISVFEFVHGLVETPKFKKDVKKHINDVVYFLLLYMQITEEQVRYTENFVRHSQIHLIQLQSLTKSCPIVWVEWTFLSCKQISAVICPTGKSAWDIPWHNNNNILTACSHHKRGFVRGPAMFHCLLNSGPVQNSYRQVELKCGLPEGLARLLIFVEPCDCCSPHKPIPA